MTVSRAMQSASRQCRFLHGSATMILLLICLYLYSLHFLVADPAGTSGNLQNNANSSDPGSDMGLGLHEAPPDLPRIIVVTPTYNRPFQLPHLTALANVLHTVPPSLLWIVIELGAKTEETTKLLNRTACIPTNLPGRSCKQLEVVHLAASLPLNFTKSKGVEQRNVALQYIEERRLPGLVYFADDDNRYAPQLFAEIRKVQRVGIWPVGFLWSKEEEYLRPTWQREPFVERPLVRAGAAGRPEVYGWETFGWAFVGPDRRGPRRFNCDMAGFAFRSEMLWETPNPKTKRPQQPIRFVARGGQLENDFLNRLVASESELEPLADRCQDVYVWHSHTEAKPKDTYPASWRVKQPVKLIPDNTKGSQTRYMVNKQRHKIEGQRVYARFRYD